jgi:hypothetical protein
MALNLISQPDLRDILYIAHNMREWDRREIFATRWDDDPNILAMDTMRWGSLTHVAWNDRRPVAVIGAIEAWPTVWSVWMYGTDEFPSVGLGMTRFVRDRLIPEIIRRGARRGECKSIDGHDQAHRWLESLGAKREGEPLLNYGKRGETFHTYVWDPNDVRRRRRQ